MESIKIDSKSLKSSIRCNKNNQCSTNEWLSCGKIDESIDNMILHIDSATDEKMMHHCDYHLPFGGDHYCTCPARMYIYEKFNV